MNLRKLIAETIRQQLYEYPYNQIAMSSMYHFKRAIFKDLNNLYFNIADKISKDDPDYIYYNEIQHYLRTKWKRRFSGTMRQLDSNAKFKPEFKTTESMDMPTGWLDTEESFNDAKNGNYNLIDKELKLLETWLKEINKYLNIPQPDQPSKIDDTSPEQHEQPVEEISTSAGAGAYMTPNAFSKNPGGKKPKGWTNAKNPYKNTKPLKEVSYTDYRNDTSSTNVQKINKSIKEVNSNLLRIERIINQNLKLKQEIDFTDNNMWKSTKSNMMRISEKMLRISHKLKNLGS